MTSTQFLSPSFQGYRAVMLAALLCLAVSPILAQDITGNTPDMTVEAPDNAAAVDDFRTAVSSLERQQGAYSADMPEKLLSLGLALQQEGRYGEALEVFKRGTHLTRINAGLYSPAQIPLVQGEITSLVAMGELEAADERQGYMLRVQQRSLQDPYQRADALIQQAEWQYQAYRMGLGAMGHARLLHMWDLYRAAVVEIADMEGNTSTSLLPPLTGMLRTQYLIADHSRENNNTNTLYSEASYDERMKQNRFNAYRAESFKQGQAIIQAIYDVREVHEERPVIASAEALIMLGDWMLWNDVRDGALQAYRDAITELEAEDDAQEQRDRLLGHPVALPALEGLARLPATVQPEGADILVEFDVNRRGRVTDLSRLAESGEHKAGVNKLLRSLRATRFRPRFEGPEPVLTENITHAYTIPDQ